MSDQELFKILADDNPNPVNPVHVSLERNDSYPIPYTLKITRGNINQIQAILTRDELRIIYEAIGAELERESRNHVQTG